MQNYTFQICRTTLALSTELPLVTGESMELFARDCGAAGLRAGCRTVPEVPEADGAPRFQNAERLIYQNGTAVTRCRRAHAGAELYARLDYDLPRPEEAALTVREADWRWATDYLRLWSTLCLPQLLLPFRTLIFHASYIGWDDKGILFTAPSGTGKFTRAELWRR